MHDGAEIQKEQILNMKRQCCRCNFINHENRKPIYRYEQCRERIVIEIRTQVGQMYFKSQNTNSNNMEQEMMRQQQIIKATSQYVMPTKLLKNN